MIDFTYEDEFIKQNIPRAAIWEQLAEELGEMMHHAQKCARALRKENPTPCEVQDEVLEAKGELIRKALGADNVQLVMEDDRVEFHWFTRELTADEVNTYMLFITALCRISKELKWVNATEKPIENEKYAFRCFLLRLGFIGDAYKPARKILLSRLTGSAAFKSGSKGGADDAVSE